MYMDLCFSEIFLKHQPLIHALTVGGYSTKRVGLIYGNLGHRLCVRGLQIDGLNKEDSKQIAKYCSVSAIIGRLHIQRRCRHLPLIYLYYIYIFISTDSLGCKYLHSVCVVVWDLIGSILICGCYGVVVLVIQNKWIKAQNPASPACLWERAEGAGGSRSWLRNRPSWSSASRFLTLKDREPVLMSGRLTSPDRPRLKDTSARQMSCDRGEVVLWDNWGWFLLSVIPHALLLGLPSGCSWAPCCSTAQQWSPMPTWNTK